MSEEKRGEGDLGSVAAQSRFHRHKAEGELRKKGERGLYVVAAQSCFHRHKAEGELKKKGGRGLCLVAAQSCIHRGKLEGEQGIACSEEASSKGAKSKDCNRVNEIVSPQKTDPLLKPPLALCQGSCD